MNSKTKSKAAIFLIIVLLIISLVAWLIIKFFQAITPDEEKIDDSETKLVPNPPTLLSSQCQGLDHAIESLLFKTI